MQLDIISYLTEKTTAKSIVHQLKWHEQNTEYLLDALTSIGFVIKDDDYYINSEESNRYLVKGKDEYLGGFLLYYGLNEGTMPMDVVELVTKGPQPMQQQAMDSQIDFAQYGALLRQSQEGYRQQEILNIVRSLPENDNINTVLDLGCATGLLGLSVIKDKEERSGVLFDMIPASLIEESIVESQIKNDVKVMTGDFTKDDIGSGYDLIMAVSVMLFAKGNMVALLKKCYDALNPHGVLLIVSEGINQDLTAPWDMVLGYLPYYFQGMDMAVKKDEVIEAAKKAGFKNFEKRSELLCSGNQDINIIRK